MFQKDGFGAYVIYFHTQAQLLSRLAEERAPDMQVVAVDAPVFNYIGVSYSARNYKASVVGSPQTKPDDIIDNLFDEMIQMASDQGHTTVMVYQFEAYYRTWGTGKSELNATMRFASK